MNEKIKNKKKEIIDYLEKQVILDVRDRSLKISMDIVKKKTSNPIKIKQYKELEGLTPLQQEAV